MKYRKILFVCSGTICSGFMASYIFKKVLSAKLGNHGTGVIVNFAGINLPKNPGINSFAKFVLEEKGIDFSDDTTAHFSKEMIDDFDIILATNEETSEDITRKFPNANGKIHTIKGFSGLPEGKGIPDPLGMGLEVYYDCALYLGVCAERIIERHFAPGIEFDR